MASKFMLRMNPNQPEDEGEIRCQVRSSPPKLDFFGIFYMVVYADVGRASFWGTPGSVFRCNALFWLFASIVWLRTMSKCAGDLPEFFVFFCELPPGKIAFHKILALARPGICTIDVFAHKVRMWYER